MWLTKKQGFSQAETYILNVTTFVTQNDPEKEVIILRKKYYFLKVLSCSVFA